MYASGPERGVNLRMGSLMKKNIACLLLSGMSTVLWAQEPESQGQLDEVVVTAERRAENVRDVPSSISTVSKETLDVLATGGQDLRVLAGRVPSLNVESSFGRAYPRF